MVEPATAAAAIAAGKLFDYNRKNFMYDRLQRLKLELQMFEFKLIKQDLFREDVTDVCELTSVKMDTYLIVNAIQIGFCIIALCEGRMQPGTPSWLVGAHLLSMVCAFSFLLLSVWFAMHALIAAKAYQTRILTQLVRLPIPSWAQLEGSRTYGSYYEKMEARQMFRVPFLCGAQENISSGGGCGPRPAAQPSSQDTSETIGFKESSDQDKQTDAATEDGVDMAADPWGLERVGDTIYELNSSYQSDPRKLRHIQLVREAMQYWQGSDAFARVSMSVGTSQFAIALAYYVLGYVLVYNHAIVGAWLAVVLFLACAWALLRIDMSLTGNEYLIATLLQVGPPLGMSLCITLWALDFAPIVYQIFLPVIYVLHAVWLLYLSKLCKVVEQKNGAMVPTGFKAVLYIDVFGWIKRGVSSVTTPSKFREKGHTLEDPGDRPGAGPAIHGIRYVNGKPVPVRPDQFSDAAREPNPSDIQKSDLSPNTFVPPHEDDGTDQRSNGTFGAKPWYVFLTLKRLFSAIWVLSAIVVAWDLWGGQTVVPVPVMLRQKDGTSMLQFEEQPLSSLSGSLVQTDWPHENVQTISLSCDSSRHMMIASSRHRIYVADLNSSAVTNRITFSSSPACEEIEGDTIQDASLQCSSGDSRSSCRALVLHQKGRRLTSCPIKKTSTGAAISTSFGGTWLRGHDSVDEVKETVQAFAMPLEVSAANNDDQTVYIATSMQRLVKMQHAVGEDGPSWFPRRLLGKSPAVPRGGMDILRDRFLVLLSSNGRRLEVSDLQNGGLSVGSWRLPGAHNWIPDGKSWTAMCATGDNLFLLSEGSSPSIWRFPLPDQLRLPEESRRSSV